LGRLSEIIQGSLEAHNAFMDRIEPRIYKTHPGAIIEREWRYYRNGLRGEIDFLVLHTDHWIFYEFKSCYRKSTAKKQYARFCQAYPERRIKGVYLGPEGCTRLG